MSWMLKLAAGVVAAAVLAGGARAQGGERSEYEFGLSSREPATRTALSLRITYRHPQDPAAKPPALDEVVLELPAGLRLDTGAVPSCAATNEELRLRGRGACPVESQVGSGTLTAATGFPGVDPVETDVTVFNGGDELIELVSFKGTDATAGYDRLKIEGNTLTPHPPATPGGPPDGRTTVISIELTIDERTTETAAGRRSLLTTPPDCPGSGAWVSRASFKFASYEATSLLGETPCSSQPARDRTPRMRVSVSPRRVRAGDRTRLRVRVRSRVRACRRDVAIRLGDELVLTGAGGHAGFTAEFSRPGRKPLRAAKRGCRSTRAWVRALPPRARKLPQ